MTQYIICNHCGEKSENARTWQDGGDIWFIDDIMETMGQSKEYDLCEKCNKQLCNTIRKFVTIQKYGRKHWWS